MCLVFCFFKQKTSNEMHFIDWSSDVCSSDLLIDPPGRVLSGEVIVGETDLLTLDEESLRRVRGTRVAMIFQDPMMTLNPVLRVDTQMVEAVQSHEKVSRKEALRRSEEALRRVGIPDRSEEHTSELQSLMRNSYAVFGLKTTTQRQIKT